MKIKLLKGQSIETWIEWVKNEISPPHELSNEEVYVLEAFLELLEKKG